MRYNSININHLNPDQIKHAIVSNREQGIKLRGSDRRMRINATDFAQLDRGKLAIAVEAIASMSRVPALKLDMEEMSEELIDDFIGMLKLHKLTPEKLHVDIETFGEPTFNINNARVAQKLPVSKKFVAEVPAKSMAIEASGRQAAHLSESLPKNLALKSLTLSPVTFNKPGFQNLTGALGQSRVEELRQGPSTRYTQIRTLQNFMQTIPPTLRENATLNKFRSDLSNSPETLTDRKLMQSRVAQKITQSMLQAGRDIPDFEQNIAGHINQFLTLQDGFNISRSNQRSYRLTKSPDNYSHQQMDSLRAAYANRRAEQAPAIQAPAAAQAAPAQAEAEDHTTAQRDQKRARLS